MLFDDLYSKLSLFFIFCQQGIEICMSATPRSAVSFTTQSSRTGLHLPQPCKSEFYNQVSGSVARKESGIASTWKKFLVLLVKNELNLLSRIVD